MVESMQDIAGQTLWFLTFITPILTLPWAWVWMFRRRRNADKTLEVRPPTARYDAVFFLDILIGMILAAALSLVFYFASLAIILRHGLGPG